MSFLIRFGDNNFNVHEKALGCNHLEICDAKSLCDTILRLVRENKLDLHKCIAQCYYGVSVMSWILSGVQKRVTEFVTHTIFVHCYTHRLNIVWLIRFKIKTISRFF